MTQDWLKEMDRNTARQVINLMDAISNEIRKHDCPLAESIQKLDLFLSHQNSLAVQHAEQLLEWMQEESINLPDCSAHDALKFLQDNVPEKYLILRNPRDTTR